MDERTWAAETSVVAAGRPGSPGEPLNVAPILASNFTLGGSHEYARGEGTPTWEALEAVIGGLEQGEATAFSTGMAAVASVFDQLNAGAVVILPDDCYQGVTGLARGSEQRGRIRVRTVATVDTDGWLGAMADADLIWLESPSNPLLAIADMHTLCAAPRKPGSILAVDNTFATPLNQRPLTLGADVVVHSATKFIGGHSDLMAGLTVTADPGLAAALRRSRQLTGATPGTLEAYLATRGARTMALRLERSQQTAMEIAERLAAHPSVREVRYPGLEDHPNHELARTQLDGFGAMLSFDLADGDAADRACRTVELIQHATSLGAVESTMERRAIIAGQEHLPPGLIRLSVGIEHVEDVWADLAQAI